MQAVAVYCQDPGLVPASMKPVMNRILRLEHGSCLISWLLRLDQLAALLQEAVQNEAAYRTQQRTQTNKSISRL